MDDFNNLTQRICRLLFLFKQSKTHIKVQGKPLKLYFRFSRYY